MKKQTPLYEKNQMRLMLVAPSGQWVGSLALDGDHCPIGAKQCIIEAVEISIADHTQLQMPEEFLHILPGMFFSCDAFPGSQCNLLQP